MRWIGAVTIIGVLTACGDSPSKQTAPGCTLPGCKSPIDLGPADELVGLTGDGVVVGTYTDPPMWDLWFRSLRDGSTTQIAAGIPIHPVRLDRDGGVLFLSDTWVGPAGVTSDGLRGSLHRWDSRTGQERVLLEEVRSRQYDVCGDWAWAWHGQATPYVNCGNTSVIDLRDGQATPLAISCDMAAEQRAFFAEGCQVVVPGAPERISLLDLVIHDPAVGASHSISGTGANHFVVSDDFSMAATGSTVTSIVHPNAQSLPERGRVLALAPGGAEVVYVADEPGDNALRLWEPGSEAPVRLSEFPGGAWMARYSPDGRLLAWIEAGGASSLHVLDRDTGVTKKIASDVHAFFEDEERFWRPAPRILAFAGEGHWLVFSVRGPDQELQLLAWDPESHTTRVLSRSLEVARKFGTDQPLAIAVGHRVAWLEKGTLRLADLETEEAPFVVATDVHQFTIGSDEIVWTHGKGKASALVYGR